MNIHIRHPTNPLIGVDVNIMDSLSSMTISSLLKEIGIIFFERDISGFLKLRDEKTNSYIDSDLPVSQLNADNEFTIAFRGEINRDIDQINAYAEELNKEAEDVLDYQRGKAQS
jgi:hypothetical protein